MKNLFIAILMCVGLIAHAQKINSVDFKTDAGATSQSIANAATAYITAPAFGSGAATIQVVATKVGGTVAGVITLQGSVDGVNFEPARLVDATTALYTVTATNVATQTFIWRLTLNSYNYYRLSWVGTGTMTATFTGKVVVKS